jgi:hypothetical protein
MQLALVTVTDANTPGLGDILIAQNVAPLVRGAAAVAQHIRQRLSFFLGEWFLDIRQGVPWFQVILNRADEATATAILRNVVGGTPGVLEVITFTAKLDRSTRRLSVSFVARTIDGDILTETDYVPLIPGA